ncbi:MAG: hypothetical protein NTY05_10785 [Rhodocyclales bacterium]|nr:hypothetical protein [Rhodocyclales bacterium]
MQGDQTQNGERRETAGELFALLAVAQKMGRRLGYETHGDAYDSVRDLNQLLHQACAKAGLIQQTLTKFR